MKHLFFIIIFAFPLLVFNQSEIGRQLQGNIIRSSHISNHGALIGLKGEKTGDGKVYYSNNNLKSWIPCNNGHSIAPEVEDVQAVLMVDDTTFLAGTWKNGLYLSLNAGKSWQKVGNFPSKDIRSFASSNSKKKTIYAATTTNGVLQSVDLGKTWTNCSDSSYYKQTSAWSLEIDQKNNILYALSFKNGVQQSFDKGKTWKNILTHKGMMIYDLVISKKDPHQIYAVGCNDSLGVIYRSKDKGENWELLTELPVGSLNQIELTGFSEKILVVGSWDKGAYVYSNGKWGHIEEVGTISVANIYASSGEVIIFSWGNGIYKIPNYWYKNSD